METIVPVFRLWTLGLHSASMSFKLLAFRALSELINSCRTAFLSLPFLPPPVVISSVPILSSLPLVSVDNSVSESVSSDKGVKAVISEETTKGAKDSKGDADATHEALDILPNTQTKTITNSDTSATSACLPDSMCSDTHPHTSRTALLNVLETCLSMLPAPRLRATAAKRLWHEIEDFPSYSRYLQVEDSTVQHSTVSYCAVYASNTPHLTYTFTQQGTQISLISPLVLPVTASILSMTYHASLIDIIYFLPHPIIYSCFVTCLPYFFSESLTCVCWLVSFSSRMI